MTHTGAAMGTARTRRTQAERDAMTVEIGFALFTGALLAGVVFALLSLPAFLGIVPRGAHGGLYCAAGSVAAVTFLARVVRVLSRFDRHRSARDADHLGGTAGYGPKGCPAGM
ncbi:DUF6332 family protein [Streptomyces sp. NPDC001904]|uniref:DUF6332 family protein n=1 Tax=Streptomyces sp. NPDC001904 TaxID=3154531 RepID=UPI003323DF35